ncbi:MAG: hypothetical protein IJL70_05655 [Treponema sp.]|nr:hypothetical protein [Treponema sp.]
MESKWKWFAAGAFTHWLLSGKKQDDAEYQEKIEKAKEEQTKAFFENPDKAATLYIALGLVMVAFFIFMLIKFKQWGLF